MNGETQRPQLVEGEIDLRAYIQVLIKYWQFIVGVAAVSAVVAGLVALTATPVYEARAGVVITQSRAELSLEPKYKTTEQGLDAKQQKVLASLVSNAAIASAVISDLGDRLPPELRDVARLMTMVEGNAEKTGLVQIRVESHDPAMAALLANTWAVAYEEYVNQLYGGGATESAAAIAKQAIGAKTDYEAAAEALVEFTGRNRMTELQRLIEEKQGLITSLQAGKQEAIARIIEETMVARQEIISAYLDAQTQNRLLAFNKDQEARRAYLAALMDAEAAARLTAIEKDREARTQVFAQYVDAGIANRLADLEQEQKAKREIFAAYAAADASAKSAVLQEQVDAKLAALNNHYQTKLKLERLLDDAKGLRAQVSQAGEMGSATNGLAILLLKAQVFASSAGLPGRLELQLGNVDELDTGAEAQLADLQTLISVLQTRINELDAAISSQSRELISNQGYDLPSPGRPEDDPLFAALAQRYADLFEVGDLAEGADDVWGESELARAIEAKYSELFGLGPLIEGSPAMSATTPILAAVKSQYPQLFTIDDLSALTWELPADNPLASIGIQVTKELLQLSDLGSLPGSAGASQELDRAIASLEKEVRELQQQLEAEEAQDRELRRARDVAWETYTTVARKAAEVNVTSSLMTTLVRFAAPAVEPKQPVPGKAVQSVLLAGIGAFVIAAGIVLFLNYMYPDSDPRTLLRRLRRSGGS